MYYEESVFLETADGGTLDLIARARKLTREYYLSDYEDTEKREAILRKLLGGMGENVAVDTPFHCDYGKNIFLGDDVIINMNCTFVDDKEIRIGSHVLIASNVQIYTASHPVLPRERGDAFHSRKLCGGGKSLQGYAHIGGGSLAMSLDNIKIIFFDIDGTLIDIHKRQISARTLETLIRLKERNIILCLSTGRSPMTVPRFEGWEPDVFLTFNGSYCYTGQQVIYKNPLSTEDAKQIVKNAAAINRPVSAATPERLAANGKDADLVKYFSLAKLDVDVSDDFDEMVENGEIYQIMSGGRESEYPAFLQDVKNAKIAAWWDRAVDIIPADSGKGVGIANVLAHYHLTKEEALAFGDGNNDIDMLQAVGTGVAMANGSEELKAVADDICGHAADDGVYHYCLEHGLIAAIG